MPAWMNCYQHPDCKEPMCALHLIRPTKQVVQGWSNTCPVGVHHALPMFVFGQPPADDAEQAAFLLGGTHAVLTLRSARILATIGELGAGLG